MSLDPGTRLGPYEVTSPLGAGGMGEVYLARDTRLDRRVAIKILSPQFGRIDDRVRRFEQEARAASTLNHPNIVTIYDIGEAGGVRFIAMEYVTGRTLRAFCGDPVAFDTLVDWGMQMAQALAVAHAAGIVHRDIKPDNVIVREDGYLKLVDFGIARLAPKEDLAADVATAAATHSDSLLGTLRYMAPEQLAGRPVTAAVDMFALGVMLYELATGRHPVRAETVLGLVQALASEHVTPPSACTPTIPAAFDALLVRLLARSEATRPSASDVHQELSAMRAGRVHPVAPLPARGLRSTTVGRQRERQVLRDAVAAAAAGRGSLVCVAGEPGIGKTTIVDDVLAESTVARGVRRVARGRCSERLAGTEAYLPWLEALDACRRDEGGEAAAQSMRRIAPTWYAQIARADQASDAMLQAEIRSASQERLKRELWQLLEDVSRQAPLVVFFDDIHWADASTIDMLAFIATRLGSMRLLIVVTYRPTDLHLARHPFLQLKPELQARGVCRELVLDFLTEAEIASYLDVEYPGHRFPPAFASLIHAKTEGNPLFMADVTRDLRDAGVIAHEAGGWVLARPLPEVEREMPESVRGMIERKIGQLSDEDRQWLIAASVQGYQFDSAVVARAIGVDQSLLEDRLETLERVHAFVKCLTDEELPDRTLTLRYRFVHVLYQEALYGTLRPTRRAALSGAIAEALLAAHGGDADRVAPSLATLFEASRDPVRAAEYFLRAARGAARVFANHEAVALARRGLQALAPAPDSPARAGLERALQLALGWPLTNVRGYSAPEVEEAYTRARALHARTGDAVEPYGAPWGLAMCFLVRADYERARALGVEILQLAGITRDGGAFITAHYMLGTVLFYLGELAASRDHYAQGIALADAHPEIMLPDGRDPAVSCRAQMGRVLWLMGYPEQARAMSEAALGRAQRAQQPLALAFALFLDTMRRQLSRDAVGTARCTEALLSLAAEHDLAQYRDWAGIVHGWALATTDPAAGIARMKESLATYEATGGVLSRSHFLALLAESLALADRHDEALPVIQDALASVARTNERYYLAELYRVEGLLAMRSPDAACRATAPECLERAVATARQQGARSWELRALATLARHAPRGSIGAAAAARLSEAYRWFTEGLDQPDQRDARALLDEAQAS